jgi:large subunit ribosomal protein L24
MATKLSVRKNDEVLVISGRDSGKRGRVLRVVPDRSRPDRHRLVVEGVNLIKRHTRPNPQKNVKGGIVEREAPIHASNVMLVCPDTSKPTRVGHKALEDGRRVRISRRSGGVMDK